LSVSIRVRQRLADTAAFEAVPGATILRKPIQIAELADAVRRTLRIDAA